MAQIPTEVPDAGTPIINAQGFIDPVWHNFFFTLLRRTGGSAGLVPVTNVYGSLPIVSSGTTEPTISIVPATPITPGSLSAADKAKLDGVAPGAAIVSVIGTAPISSSGGNNPNISISPATVSLPGSMSAADKVKLNGITPGAAVASVSGSAPIVSSGGTSPAISITNATTGADGAMSAADKVKLNGIGTGATVTGVTGTAPIVSSGGAAPAISIVPATGSVPGSMSAADKAKLDSLVYATGNWTPAISFVTPGNLAVSYTTQVGHYTQIGRKVSVDFEIVTSSFTWTTAAGALRITGLPLAANSSVPEFTGLLSWAGIVTTGYTSLNATILSTDVNAIRFQASGNNVARVVVSAPSMPTGNSIVLVGSIEYFI